MSRNYELLVDTTIASPLGQDSANTATASVGERQSAPSRVSSDEALSPLVQKLFLARDHAGVRHVLFCGAEGASNGSSVCLRAARELAARSSRSVCLIDLEDRTLPGLPSVESGRFAPASEPGESLRDSCCRQLAKNLWIAEGALLSAGRGDLLPKEDLIRELALFQGSFDHVLINAPAATASVEAGILGTLVDGAVLIVEANRTRRVIAKRAKEVLESSGVHLLGTVLNNRTFPIPATIYNRL